MDRAHEVALLKARIVELRDQGMGFREIAAEVGLSVEPTWRHYQNAMRDVPAPAVEAHATRAEARKEAQLRRIDMQREIHEAIIQSAHKTVTVAGKVLDVEDHGPVFAATDRLVKLDAQEADLLGLKSKTEIEHTGTLKYEILGLDTEDLM